MAGVENLYLTNVYNSDVVIVTLYLKIKSSGAGTWVEELRKTTVDTRRSCHQCELRSFGKINYYRE